MTHQLFIADPGHSSWSLRGWLLFEKFGLPKKTTWMGYETTPIADHLADHRPARTAPALITQGGAVIWDSLAMAEELASLHPDAGIWPSDPSLRATARSLAAEMHSGFMALRDACSFNLFAAYKDVPFSDAVLADVARLEEVWSYALTQSGGPWLCGNYSAADVFFAPVAARAATFGLPLAPQAQAYVDAHLADPAFRRWRAMGFAFGREFDRYKNDYAPAEWRGVPVLPATAIDTGTPENEVCPYSGDPITHLMQVQGRVFGFCNAFCRDKSVADPMAWPQLAALITAG